MGKSMAKNVKGNVQSGRKPVKQPTKSPLKSKPTAKGKKTTEEELQHLTANLLASLKEKASECGLYEEYTPEAEGMSANSPMNAIGDGSRLKKIFDFLVQIAPLIIPLIFADEAPPAMSGTAEETPTPVMGFFGINLDNIQEIVNHVINLLESQGQEAVSVVNGIMKVLRAVTGRDMTGVFTALSEVTDDVTDIITAVKEEFGL